MSNLNFHSRHPELWLDSPEDREIQERLELFQVFSKIYTHNRALLNEILELENSNGKSLARSGLFFYLQGVVSTDGAYLITNLLDGKTQALKQSTQIWTIGRDPRQVALILRDKRLSRTHAAIWYLPQKGFFLSDLESRNGSYVNGERIKEHYLLKDGDRIRLGSITFSFFVCSEFKSVSPPSLQCLQHLQESSSGEPTLPPDSEDEQSEIVGITEEKTVGTKAKSPVNPMHRTTEETVQFPWLKNPEQSW
ncbi:MAG: FHA domain-containing protein [Cyanobacteria bacterium J06635_15]